MLAKLFSEYWVIVRAPPCDSWTAGLSEDALAKSQAIRSSARKAVIEMQDDKAMRAALAARPRTVSDFQAGDLVAYWRNQKLEQGTIRQGGKWHGVAIVIGSVGRNLIIAQRKQIFRCAPEQLRPATTEEKTVVSSPEVELLGIKDLIEGGTFRSKQYVDLVSSHYPPYNQNPSEAKSAKDHFLSLKFPQLVSQQ